MTKLDAYKILGYNYISKDEMDERGNIRIQIWFYKPSLVLIDDIYYTWGASREEWDMANIYLHSEVENTSDFNFMLEGECVELSHFSHKVSLNKIYDALKMLGFKYLARNENGLLMAFKYRPVREKGYMDEFGVVKGKWTKGKKGKSDFNYLPVFNDVFNFITWESGVYKII